MQRHFVSTMVIVAVCAAAQVMAETPSPYPSFTFKRVGVPNKGATNRIKVQIAPTDQLVLAQGASS